VPRPPRSPPPPPGPREPHPLFHVVPGDVESWEHAVI